MQLIYYPNPILLAQCKTVPDSGVGQSSKERATLAAAMWEIMNKNDGVGLAAPQVGLNIRMFVWSQGGSGQSIWNPVLNLISGCVESTEGCLSLPKVNVTIQRATSSKLTATGINVKPLLFIGNTITTRIWQHEIDHLDGKLIIDNMSRGDTIANRDALRTLLKNIVA